MPRQHSSNPRRTHSRNILSKLMMSVMGFLVVALGLFLLADRLGGATLDSSQPPSTTASPTAISPADLKSPREVVEAYVELWEAGDYAGMYDLLSTDATQGISREDFVTRYQGIAQEVGLVSLEVEIGPAADDAPSFPIHVVRESGRVGQIEDDNTIPIVRDEDGFRVDWSPSLIFADLGDGFVRWKPDVPQRGRILDRKGRPLAHLGTISKVGIIPGQIEDEQAMLNELSKLLEMPPDVIKSKYANGQPDWFMPVRNFPNQMDPELHAKLTALPGIVIQKWPARAYPAGPAAAHIVGYLTEVTAEELPELSKRGYGPGNVIGRAGLEAWGEQYLAGKRGGRLVIVGPDGVERKTLAEVKSEPAADIVLTIDLDVQLAAHKALGNKTGSIVVLDPNSGAILAMASNPSFDPNQFILGHTEKTWAEVSDPERHPLTNRATQVAYPSGSTFKVVTMTAGMESLGLTADTAIPCPGTFSLPGSNQVWRDWSLTGQGVLTLHNALVQSCNTVFYRIGADLDAKDPSILAKTARGFGFGTPTGLAELPEVAGIVPDPDWKVKTVGDYWARGDAVNFSIGQGYFLATPLQVANTYAAIANGGTLWRPFLVQEVVALDGSKVYTAEPEERGKLPISPEHLGQIRSALRDVVSAPNGTAVGAFNGATHPAAGKTGTAENAQGDPHAWFAGFSPVDGVKLAAVAMIEHGGEGSRTSAPMVRQVIDAYYRANPQ